MPALERGQEVPDPSRELRALLLGDADMLGELPALPDLIAAAISLASGLRRKLNLPLSQAPAEFTLVRDGDRVWVDCYGTESTPEIFVRRREVALRDLVDGCVALGRRLAQQSTEPVRATALQQLGQRLHDTAIQPDAGTRPRPLRCTGGSLESPGRDVPLAFGFQAEIVPSFEPAAESHAFADVHALLFEGTLWAFAGDKRLPLFEGPIMLAAQRMVAAVRALCEAWQADRAVHVRLRSGRFAVSVRRERNRRVALTLSGGQRGALTWPALEVTDAALPILRLASDMIRKLIAVDRRQSHNLRVTALRSEVRALRRMIRARGRRESFENADPERLRLPQSAAPRAARAAARELSPPLGAGLRYSERWSVEIDGLDASALFLCGERLVVATQKLLLALNRKNGQVLWSAPNVGACAMQAGASLLRLLPNGTLELHELEDGNVYARTETTARGGEAVVLHVGGPSLPPTAILTESRQHVVAIDLRTGQPRWRFRAQSSDGLQLARSGRVLCVTSGDGSVDALDVTSGEVVWRFSDNVRFCLKPCVCRDVVIAAAGEPRGGGGALYGIDLYTGRLLWQRELPAAPSCDPIDAGEVAVISHGRSRQSRLLAIDPRDGTPRFTQADPGLDNGGQAVALDHTLIVNTPSGRILALDLNDGQTQWSRPLSNPLTDDVPRQLEPVLRQGALFVPSAQVHVLRPSDGTPLGHIQCDLVPDWLCVDERGMCYVAEESGHLSAYAPGPHLTLVR